MRKLSSVLLCLFAGAITASAQSNYAVIRGSVLDPQHRPIPGAHIRAIDVSTGAQREVVSNESGLYQIPSLQPGTYTLTIDSQGFAETKENLTLEVGQQATIDISMHVSKDTQTVNVEASGELLKT